MQIANAPSTRRLLPSQIVFTCGLALALLACVNAASLAAERVAWRSAAEVRQQLQGAIRLTWPSNPLRDSLANLSQATRVPIWLDRRIDPDQRIEFKSAEVPLQEALRNLAGQLDGNACLVGSVVFIGAKSTAPKLQASSAARREEAARLPDATRRKLLAAQAWQWPELAEPRELLAQLAAEGGLKLSNAEQLPHDLWLAGDWPALALADRLSLLLAGFDLTYEISSDGAALKLVPFPQSAPVKRTHEVKGDAKQFAEKLTRLFPAAVVQPIAGKVIVTATPEEQEQIAQLAVGEPARRPAPAGGQTVYTLKLENQPVGGAAKALADRVGLELKLDPALSEAQLSQRVSFQVKEATLDGLFTALLKPAGLAHKVNGKTLEVFERPK